ncbi:hypothetical protein ACFRKD_08215 [Streptomyces niveus]|uniref:hypothetical protein n=1 Tax=Streptomyces niveus TaxID=193462 RepID=UPI0036A867B7
MRREGEHVVVDALRTSAVVAFGRGDDLAFEGLLPDVVVFDLPGDGEYGEEHRAHAVGIVDPGERAGEEFDLDAVGLELGGRRHQLCRVLCRTLQLVRREDVANLPAITKACPVKDLRAGAREVCWCSVRLSIP